MLEQLSLSVSTLLFFLCTFVVGSFFPTSADAAAEPCEVPAITVFISEEAVPIIGKWNSGGHIIEFTKSGKLIYDNITFDYKRSGNTITVSTDIGGITRDFTVSVESCGDRVIKINGIAMYRTE